jgi:DnaJ-like protein/PilZ domain-containing protein
MPYNTERRKKTRQRNNVHAAGIWITLLNSGSSPADIRARVIDASDGGIQIETPIAIERYAEVLIDGSVIGVDGKVSTRVVRCSPAGNGRYNIGLMYGSAEPAKKIEAVPDYYEVLQVHSKADPETIHRVYRILAQRFHPDNAETGNAETFRAILSAYQVLSDPEKRAAYDVHLNTYRQVRWRLFDHADAAVGRRAERHKRHGVLDLLYTARMNQPAQPALTLHELEDLLGCPREHLEFSLWYLKENALLTRTDNGRYSITAKGVDRLEADSPGNAIGNRLLPGAG